MRVGKEDPESNYFHNLLALESLTGSLSLSVRIIKWRPYLSHDVLLKNKLDNICESIMLVVITIITGIVIIIVTEQRNIVTTSEELLVQLFLHSFIPKYTVLAFVLLLFNLKLTH